ncbi:MAG: 2-amino-4-hydroxy-6-hydroxymethyldihydropteridine diphosphokinase [Paraprevotella sp.]|nr:2-amino-4-hydroxy-6-hydroxymethyldihydropteridine diphosphokinase [Paraprevotella sp.]
MTHKLYLGLGSNQGHRLELLLRAIQLIEERIGPVQERSALYETPPWGFDSPHPFLNAVVGVHTELTPEQILFHTQCIERELGRTTKSVDGHYSDRPIDIDLLFFDSLVLEADYLLPGASAPSHLSLPHPLLHLRTFVLCPLADVAPHFVHPILGRTVSELLQSLPESEVAACRSLPPYIYNKV